MRWFKRSTRWTVGHPSVVVRTVRPWSELFETLESDAPDYRWAGPTHECLCGGDLFAVAARFYEGKVAFYFTDARCLTCGSHLRAPTEADVAD